MDFDELLIVTGVDALIRLVKDKNEIELIDAASQLKLPIQTVREWAQVLEDEGLISVKYKLAKSYLCWVQPTKEQIEEERYSFSEEKSSLSQELSQLDSNLDSEKQSLENLRTSFNQLYESLYPKLKELDERTKSISSVEKKETEISPKYTSKLNEILSKLDDLDSMLVFTQSQLTKTRKEILENSVTPDEVSSLKAVKAEISAINTKLSDLEEKAYSTIKTLPTDTVKYADFPKQLSEIKKEFHYLLSESKKTREILLKSDKNLDQFKKLKTELDSKGVGFPALKLELSELSKNMASLETRFASLSGKIDRSRKVIDSFAPSGDLMDTLSKSGSLKEKFDKIEKGQKALEDKIKTLEQSSEGLEGVADLVLDFDNIRKEIDAKRDHLSESAADIFNRLDEEDETYKVFQKIKEKALSSIEEYSHQLSSIKSELQTVSSETVALEKQLKEGIKKAVQESSDKEVSSLIARLEQIKKKRELFDQIKGSVGSLGEKLENLSKRVTLLSKQAELIEIRSSKSSGQSKKELMKEEKELESEVELTKSEQVEFQRKRKELMSMIKKLWEEG